MGRSDGARHSGGGEELRRHLCAFVPESWAVVLGPSGVGKTVIVDSMHAMCSAAANVGKRSKEQLAAQRPTSFCVTFVEHNGLWDAGNLTLWCGCFPNLDGIIYVVDATNTDVVEQAKAELSEKLASPELRGACLLVFANKQDHPGALDPAEVAKMLGEAVREEQLWHVQGSCAVTAQGLRQGLDWLARAAEKRPVQPAGIAYNHFAHAALHWRLHDAVRSQSSSFRKTMEARLLEKEPLPFVEVPPAEAAESRRWRVAVRGPPDTPFEGGEYMFELRFSALHPAMAPEVRCLTENGRIPCDQVPLQCISQWTPKCSIGTVLAQLMEMLLSPGGASDDEKAQLAVDCAPDGRPLPAWPEWVVARDKPSDSLGDPLQQRWEQGALLQQGGLMFTLPHAKDRKADALVASLAQVRISDSRSASGSGSSSEMLAKLAPHDMGGKEDFDKVWAGLDAEATGHVPCSGYAFPSAEFWQADEWSGAAMMPSGELVLVVYAVDGDSVAYAVRSTSKEVSQGVAAGLQS